jgi:hypothetical protein
LLAIDKQFFVQTLKQGQLSFHFIIFAEAHFPLTGIFVAVL